MRNDVTSSALMKPNGFPSEVMRFRTPWGVVPSFSFDGGLSRSAGGGRSFEGVASVTTVGVLVLLRFRIGTEWCRRVRGL